MSRLPTLTLLAMLCLQPASPGILAQAPERTPILLDTDIGTDIDDAFALGFVLGSRELDLRGVTTAGGNTQQRAMMVCRFFTVTGRRHTPVAVGPAPQPERAITSQYQYYYHPDVLFDRTKKPEKQTAVDFLHARLKSQPGRITVLACGPLTNVARMLKEKPDALGLIKQIVLVESNLALDVPAAREVIASGVPLVIVSKEAVAGLKLTGAQVRKVLDPGTALSHQVETLYQLWDQEEPPLADVLAAFLCFDERFCKLADRAVTVDDRGNLRAVKGEDNARVTTDVDREAFVKWYVERMSSLLPPERRPSQLVEQGAMPHRVHVAEDYDLDIERRWWMSGKAETANLPPGSRRACRGVLTHDFDDLLMVSRKMYTAVVFNPVPGPPMGKNTHLSFRYWLKGTDTIRVQIYSLSNGYHRQLYVKGLPQGRWQHATVDMTEARRPDGTGGPLSEGERIDDIQFYIDPDAEILIDDVVLYDAAAQNEKRSFPKQVIFTGTFDSGKQGKEWPGTFDIVPDEGSFWKAARSVDNSDLAAPWIRLHLRGERPLGEATHLSFRYRLKGADRMRIELPNRTTGKVHVVELSKLAQGEWAEGFADFSQSNDKSPAPKKGELVDEIHFVLPKGAELLVDDVLLYEPGK